MKIRMKQAVAQQEVVTNGSRVLRKTNGRYLEEVDRYYDLVVEIDEAEAEFKRKYKVKMKERDDLKEKFLGIMKEEKVETIRGDKAQVTAKQRSTGHISPQAFLQFLKSIGQKAKFWEYVSIGLGEAKKTWGENTLLDAGVLETEINPYSSLEVTKL